MITARVCTVLPGPFPPPSLTPRATPWSGAATEPESLLDELEPDDDPQAAKPTSSRAATTGAAAVRARRRRAGRRWVSGNSSISLLLRWFQGLLPGSGTHPPPAWFPIGTTRLRRWSGERRLVDRRGGRRGPPGGRRGSGH